MSEWFHRIEKSLERVHLVAWLLSLLGVSGTTLTVLVGVLIASTATIRSDLGLIGVVLVVIPFAAAFVLLVAGTVFAWKRYAQPKEPTQDSMLPLRDAVGQALAATRDTGVAAFLSGSGERDTVYGYFVEMVHRGVPIYGKTPPASDWVKLDSFDPNEETLSDDMTALLPHHQEPRLTDLNIRRGDLQQFVNSVLADGGGTPVSPVRLSRS
jgi:hypothetical protein